MEKKLVVDEHYAITRAVELTKLAIENSMIQVTNDSKETADNVYDFCNQLYLNLTGRTNDQ